jgi:copper chaperone
MATKTYRLDTLTCPGCVLKIEGAVKKIKGVTDVQVLFNASKVKVTFDENLENSNKIGETISKLGFEVLGEN